MALEPIGLAGSFTLNTDYGIEFQNGFSSSLFAGAGCSFLVKYKLRPAAGTTSVTAQRYYDFTTKLLGYPYIESASLRRHLPEPLREAGQYQDYRPYAPGYATFTYRWRYWCTSIVSVNGKAWRGLTDSDEHDFDNFPLYEHVEIVARFEQPPYEIIQRVITEATDDPPAPEVFDPAWNTEASRYVVYDQNPQSRLLQTKLGIAWDADDGYGQPDAANRVAGSALSFTEGVPIVVGGTDLVWTWIDVPVRGFNWPRIESYFNCVNDDDFRTVTSAPFRVFKKESLLFKTAKVSQHGSCTGEQLFNITFFFEHAPWTDGLGYWNRLMNKKSFAQRIEKPDGDPLYTTVDFDLLFSP